MTKNVDNFQNVACERALFKNFARARAASVLRVRTRFARGVAEHWLSRKLKYHFRLSEAQTTFV